MAIQQRLHGGNILRHIRANSPYRTRNRSHDCSPFVLWNGCCPDHRFPTYETVIVASWKKFPESARIFVAGASSRRRIVAVVQRNRSQLPASAGTLHPRPTACTASVSLHLTCSPFATSIVRPKSMTERDDPLDEAWPAAFGGRRPPMWFKLGWEAMRRVRFSLEGVPRYAGAGSPCHSGESTGAGSPATN